MSLERDLSKRSDNKCELCANEENLSIYQVPSSPKDGEEASIMACSICIEQMDDSDKRNANHWRCLNDSMWSTVPAVQVMAWRMLHRLKSEG